MNKNYKENLKNRDIKESKKRLNIKEYKVKESTILIDYLINNIGLKRTNAKKLLSNHMLSINGAPTSQFDFKLSKDDILIISKAPIKDKKRKDLPIIYEDDNLIVIDKPFGLLSIPSDKEKSSTAYRMVSDYIKEKNKKDRIYVVHRLDKETSGVLVFAKNEILKEKLQSSWNNIVLKRGYFAIVEGNLEKKEDRTINYIAMNSLNLMYVTSKSNKKAYKCITNYKVIKENDKYSLLDINIETGRKNQIRITLGSLNHFVLGDDKYGNPANPINRLALHAYELSFINPLDKKTYTFKSKMPKEFLSLFK